MKYIRLQILFLLFERQYKNRMGVFVRSYFAFSKSAAVRYRVFMRDDAQKQQQQHHHY